MADLNIFAGYARKVSDTYNYSNSTRFYSLANYSVLNYYQRVIRPCQEWLDGYVWGFHNAREGIVSTRIASKIIKGVARTIIGRGLCFKKGKGTLEDECVKFISSDWAKSVNLNKQVKNCVAYTVSLGTSLLKLNKKSNGELWLDTLRADYFYFSCDEQNNLIELTCFIRCFTSTKNDKSSYFLVEKRYYKVFNDDIEYTTSKGTKLIFNAGKKVPYVKYVVLEVPTTDNNNFSGQVAEKSINFKMLPEEVKSAINKEYSGVLLDKEVMLPFKDLGAVLVCNEEGDCTHPSLPFGTPILFDCIADFMEYDMDKSYAMRDLYQAKGTVGIPKSLSQSNLTGVMGTNVNEDLSGSIVAQNSTYELVPGLNPEKQSPIITQFEIRAVEHETKQNAILKSIATTIGVSPRVIASYLTQGYEKTATQVASEDDTAIGWVNEHRTDYIAPLNYIVETVLGYYGYVGNVEVGFASSGLVNPERQLALITDKLKLNLMSWEDAIKELNPDLDDIQIKAKIKELKENEIQKKPREQITSV